LVSINASTCAETGQSAIAVLRDKETENAVKAYFSERGVNDARLVRGGIGHATELLSRERSPRLLIVDVSGEIDPVSELRRLAEFCDPSSCVVAVGDRNDVAVYRGLKDIGVSDYFYKPLAFELLAQACDPVLTRKPHSSSLHTGRVVIVFGVRGGVGTTTVAVNTAWHLAEALKRRVVLLDLDLQGGDAALHLDAKPSGSLSEVLCNPDRLDQVLIERAVTRLSDRLDLLASLEPLSKAGMPEEEAVLSIIDKLRERYRYVVVDLPFWIGSRYERLRHLPATLILVSDETLASARDTLRWREQVAGAQSDATSSILILLNKAHAAGALTDTEFENALGQKPDLVVPFEPEIAQAANLGLPAIARSDALRRALAGLFARFSGESGEVQGSLLRRVFGR
jgi:pilus assembly protein CpaE